MISNNPVNPVILSKNTVFIVNPNAGMGAVGRQWPRIEALARARMGPFHSFLTTGPGDATLLTRQALLEGSDLIVCVGGDGTLNEVVNGFMNEHGPVRPDAMLGFIPNGTGCDFIRTVPIPRDPQQALDVIAGLHSRSIDLGRLSYRDHQGGTVLRYFHNVTSFGLGGEVDERANGTTKVFGGFFSFIWATVVSLLLYDKKRIRLRVDDDFDETVLAWNVAVANGQYHGGGMQIAPDASANDGLFHVTIVGDLSLPEVFASLHNLYNGKIYQVKNVRSLTGRRIEAFSDQRVLLDVDGEQPGTLPVTIDIVPDALRIIVPG